MLNFVPASGKQPTSPEAFVSKFAVPFDGRSHHIISNLPIRPRLSTIKGGPAQTNIGLLTTLPTDILLPILESLDFQSLSRLSRTCRYANFTVSSLPSYWDMMRHGSEALAALSVTRLIPHHSAAWLHRRLRSEKCASCSKYGGFLFLPTCERACLFCLHVCLRFRLVTRDAAAQFFKLEPERLNDIPAIHTTHPVRLNGIRQTACEFLSLKQVRQLAVEVHGSLEKIIPYLPPAPAPELLFEVADWRRMHRSFECPLDIPSHRIHSMMNQAFKNLPVDTFGGFASVRFSSLENGFPEGGLICLGCQNVCELMILRMDVPEQNIFNDLGLSGKEHYHRDFIHAEAYRLRNKADLLEHVPRCWGVQQLIKRGHFYLNPSH